MSIACGVAFARLAPHEAEAPARGAKKAPVALPPALLARVFGVMTVTAVTGSLLFNFTTNGNGQLLRERMAGVVDEPAELGLLLAAVYVVASFSQLAVGRLIDRQPLKRLYLAIVLLQPPLLALAAQAHGWALAALLVAAMVVIFGAIPFVDAMIVRYVDDRMRSRVSGMRLAVSFGISSLAVWLLGPVVKSAGFETLLLAMAGIALVTAAVAAWLPGERAIARAGSSAAAPAGGPAADERARPAG